MTNELALGEAPLAPVATSANKKRVCANWRMPSKLFLLLVICVLQLGPTAATGGRLLRSSTKSMSAGAEAAEFDESDSDEPKSRHGEENDEGSSSSQEGRRLQSSIPYRVGAFYYPSWGPDFHYGFGTLRDKLGQTPQAGAKYDDTTEEVIREHMEQMEKGNIDLWISSWLGPTSREDQTLLRTVLPTLSGSDHEVAVLYETEKLLMNGFTGDFSTDRVVGDIDHLTEEFFTHSQYYKIRGRRPVVVLKLTPSTVASPNLLEELVLKMRTEANKHDYSLFLVAAYAGGATPDSKGVFDYFDAVTNMDFAGSVGLSGAAGVVNATEEEVEAHFELEDTISQDAFVRDCWYIPTVSPGWNGRAFLGDTDLPILSRELSGASDPDGGTLFKHAIAEAKKRVRIEAEYLMFVESFNQWHMDTQIEAITGPTPNGNNALRGGLEYPAYGTLYLDILYNLTWSRPVGPDYPDTYKPDPEDDFSQGSLNVGVYYYPWHGNDFHRGGGYARKDIGHTPTLGEYDDRSPEVVAAHLSWSRQGNINTWICSWWGPGSREDTTIKNSILKHPDLANHKIGLFYETTGRIRGNNDKVASDIRYMCSNYFDHDNYLRINDRPVLFVYVTRVLHAKGTLGGIIALMRQAAADNGYPDIYIVGDQVFGSPPNQRQYHPFDWLDAVTTYDVYGDLARGYAHQEQVDRHYDRQNLWKEQAEAQGSAFIPAVNAGYNDRGVRLDAEHLPLSRQLTPESRYGTLFAANLKRALDQLDSKSAFLLLINSFNEWHEDSQIEPCDGGETYQPYEITKGIRYKGYGTLYLDILSNATRAGDFEVPDTPESRPPSGRDLYMTQEDVNPAFRSFSVDPDGTTEEVP
eukprot:CAMPEP_0194028372 /NCGR_PEP_ID=MMETSP0009_2-20130614/2356_1 /TAXON_ID=210454 /ORGANISM="Grammatophora oceanica, Strain CCMP 410" /LENGTH=860 /DNA_ID=CAMNT_0038667743 /DNA_START=216 /DNA_END=2794 /DNA_ORIENTATION=+